MTRGAGADRIGRLADERLADARARAVLRRHVLPAARRRARRAPRLPDAAARAVHDVPRGSGRASGARRRRWSRRGARSEMERRPRRRGGGRAPGRVADRRHGRRSSSALFDDRERRRCAARRSSRRTSRSACCCAQHRAHRRRRGAADGDADAGEDGGRRHVRPARRRLPPLLDRRALAGAALREDALRQRAAGRRLRRGATR